MNTNTFKKILLILIGVIVVGGAVGYIYLTHTNKEIESLISESDKTVINETQQPVVDKHPDWKTCKSETYGYEFSYPADLSIESNYSETSLGGTREEWDRAMSLDCEKRILFLSNIMISIVKPSEFNESSFINTMVGTNGIRFVRKSVINNINTFWFESNCDEMGECGSKYSPFVIFVKNNTQFWISDFTVEQSTIVADIIETFKFTQ